MNAWIRADEGDRSTWPAAGSPIHVHRCSGYGECVFMTGVARLDLQGRLFLGGPAPYPNEPSFHAWAPHADEIDAPERDPGGWWWRPARDPA